MRIKLWKEGDGMYRLKTVFLSVYRHKRRNILSCFLLLTAMSVVFCGCFYREYARTEAETVGNKYRNRCYISFRNELQYAPEYPHFSALDARLNGTSRTDGVPDVFFDAEAMAEYDHPYPAELEHFQTLGNSGECEDYKIAYAGNAYGFAEELPEQILESLEAVYSSQGDGNSPGKILTEHIMVGGSLDAFTGIARETSSGDLYDFILLEGSEEPGRGECVITDFYADLYRKTVGDSIVLQDIYGDPLIELTVVGIYGLYATEYYEHVNPQIPRSGRKLTGTDLMRDYSGSPDVGTPFDRLGEDTEAKKCSQEHYFGEYFRVDSAMIGLIHTDLETAYDLYGAADDDGAGRHFNHFFAYYDLKDGADPAEFEKEMKRIFPEQFREEFTVYAFENSHDLFVRAPQELFSAAKELLHVSGWITVLLLGIVMCVSVRENGKETGIYLSLGISEKDIVWKTALENTLITALAAGTAAFCGRFVHAFLADSYTYLQLSEAEYSLTGESFLFAGAGLAVNFLMAIVFMYVYIHVHSPLRLMRRE